tara:strand:+ start:212 stop:400 length:189 start_codon:yes stop_codon:yes gene_type:complete
MSIDPEVIPPSSSAAVGTIPRWAVYSAIGLAVLILVGILKTFLSLIVMGLVLGFIWKQAKIN